jgi:cyclic pyranopterin monophosphate synthase
MFNHFDAKGQAVMVDVSAKQPTMRTAVATALVRLKPATLQAILDGKMTKGDVFGVARLAGIAAPTPSRSITRPSNSPPMRLPAR